MNETSEELFPNTPDAVRAILAQIRHVVRGALPEATEIFQYGALGYGPTTSGFDRILYVMPQDGYANLGFFYGVGVADPTGLLEGTGKRMRHTKIRTVLAAENPELIPLVQDAWKKGIISVAQLHESRKKRPAGLEER